MIHRFREHMPQIAKAAFIAWNAEVIGNVDLGENSSIWFSATLRGDMDKIVLGDGSNVQDGAVLHVDHNAGCIIGSGVTIGHGAILHACTVEDNCLIGMGSTILNGAVIKKGSIVGAGALVTPGKTYPERSLIVGSPAKSVRQISDEEYQHILDNGIEYINLAQDTNLTVSG